MRQIWTCRRTYLGTLGILALTYLGVSRGTDVSLAISAVVASVAAANAYQGRSGDAIRKD